MINIQPTNPWTRANLDYQAAVSKMHKDKADKKLILSFISNRSQWVQNRVTELLLAERREKAVAILKAA